MELNKFRFETSIYLCNTKRPKIARVRSTTENPNALFVDIL